METKKSDERPREITHYTNTEGLIGILRSGKIRASNVSFLNDRAELLHGLAGVRQALAIIKKNDLTRDWAQHLDEVIKELENGAMPDTYAACFCDGADILSQWRGYGGEKYGVAITFHLGQLERAMNGHGITFNKVIYSDKSTKSKMSDRLKQEIEWLSDVEDLLGDKLGSSRKTDIFKAVTQLLPQFKHWGFRDEREWRFVLQKKVKRSELCFRAKDGIIIPYIEVGPADDNLLPVNSVTIGPSPDQELAERSVQTFLAAMGYKKVDVHRSNVPFRG